MAQARSIEDAALSVALYQTKHPGREFRTTQHEIAEVLHCIDCGADVESLVFGDTRHVRCHSCGRTFIDRLDAEAETRAARVNEEIEFADRYMRDGGSGWGAD